ncbi:uroporphyrinogen-III C-methyltransferase [Roseospira marina]|uniref:uroporphyrinogen-III C-methyltransferase n=1 Tax=Roseospira marina TaxID=140057 RepID=A0A5M6I8Y3_9PROT|nr:uroporphyrinogen-III C-methyltransferase [Roseospira marina]KAA5604720.1 uroporphyrinogen-III C-methyltransferase [Roseospira marina]MBB4315169.1 uroporphyrin-III C-methyltransferase [Roseospira marina]MBB5088061.1 uroporphyrin-III C-methyltransferase [Roseospira marina]
MTTTPFSTDRRGTEPRPDRVRLSVPFALPPFQPGWVWLVGAGPGDPGLLTLHAAHALGQADVVVHDALVNMDVLALARSDAEIIYAGKRGGKPSASQPDISNRLIALARDGRRVLRLKGGDPFIFGRGGEEARALVEADVPFRVVPGITSGIGGLAYAGIPATTRDTNASIAFITGHAASGRVPDTLDWPALARSASVLVIYMAVKHLPIIVGHLMDAGRSPDEPLAFICSATTPQHRVVTSTLGRAVADRDAHGVEAPAIVVVGEVVRLREQLGCWWDPTELAPPATGHGAAYSAADAAE